MEQAERQRVERDALRAALVDVEQVERRIWPLIVMVGGPVV